MKMLLRQDPSGRMKGYFHPDVVEEHGPDLAPGAALLLKEASVVSSRREEKQLDDAWLQ